MLDLLIVVCYKQNRSSMPVGQYCLGFHSALVKNKTNGPIRIYGYF